MNFPPFFVHFLFLDDSTINSNWIYNYFLNKFKMTVFKRMKCYRITRIRIKSKDDDQTATTDLLPPALLLPRSPAALLEEARHRALEQAPDTETERDVILSAGHQGSRGPLLRSSTGISQYIPSIC